MNDNTLAIGLLPPAVQTRKTASISRLDDHVDRRNIRLVVIDCPYESWHAPFPRELFAKMVDLKLRGFKSHYSHGVLPLDTTDFLMNAISAVMDHAYVSSITPASQFQMRHRGAV